MSIARDNRVDRGRDPIPSQGATLRIFLRTHAVAVLLITALVFRIVWVLVVHPVLKFDAAWYDARAWEIRLGRGYSYGGVPTAFFPVGYPLFLASVYRLAGHRTMLVELLQAVISAIVVGECFLVTRRMFGKRAALFAAALIALDINQIAYTSMIVSETLFAVLLTGFFCIATAPSWEQSTRRRMAAGLVLGVAALVRPTALIILPCAALDWSILRKHNLRTAMILAASVAVPTLIVVLPWTVRNAIVMRHFALVSTNDCVDLWMGQTQGHFEDAPLQMTANWKYQAGSPADEIASERAACRAAFDAIRAHPMRPVELIPRKLVHFFYANIDGLLANSGFPVMRNLSELPALTRELPASIPAWLKLAIFVGAQLQYLVTMALAVSAIVTYSFRRRANTLIVASLGAWVMIHVLIFFPSGRFRLPMMPLCCAFAGAAIVGLTRRDLPLQNRSRVNRVALPAGVAYTTKGARSDSAAIGAGIARE